LLVDAVKDGIATEHGLLEQLEGICKLINFLEVSVERSCDQSVSCQHYQWRLRGRLHQRYCCLCIGGWCQFGSIVVACMRGRGDGRAKLGLMGCQSVSLLVALGVFGVGSIVGIIVVFVVLEGKSLSRFSIFLQTCWCNASKSKGAHVEVCIVKVWWEGVISQGGVLLGLLLWLIGVAHGSSYCGVKKEIFLPMYLQNG